MLHTRTRELLARAASWLGLFGVYVATAKLGLALDPVEGFAALVWPPTGLALAALARGGPGLWPAVMAGAVVANLWSGAPWHVAVGIAVGNTLGALLGAHILRRAREGDAGPILRVRHALALLVAALFSPIISASAGVFSLWLGGLISSARALEVWQAWWLGNVLGALVVTPPLLSWSRGGKLTRGWARAPEAAALIILVLGSAALSFSGDPATPLRRPHMIFPALIWAAIRFGPGFASFTVLVVSVIAVGLTAHGTGSYVSATLHENLIELQGFMSTVAVTGIFLAAASAERSAALRLLAQKHAQLHAIAEATSDSISIKDLEGRYLLVNPAYASILGSDPPAVHGKVDADFFSPDVARCLRQRDQLAVASEKGLLCEESILVDGEPRTFSSAKAPYRVDGELLGNISISRDITRQKNDEASLRDALGARDEFLSVAGHELRTPLAALSLQVTGLERALRGKSSVADESQRDLQRAGRAVAQVERLTRLVDRLLDVSRIAEGRVHLRRETIDLSELTRSVVRGLEDQATHAGCTVDLTAHAAVLGTWDRSRIEQVVGNLLTNAFKYGAGKPVEVVVEASESTAIVRVCDHGIGISPDALDRVFNRFERFASGHRRKSLGISLFVARQVVEAHAGSIRVESTPEVGSTFFVELPRSGVVEHPEL